MSDIGKISVDQLSVFHFSVYRLSRRFHEWTTDEILFTNLSTPPEDTL